MGISSVTEIDWSELTGLDILHSIHFDIPIVLDHKCESPNEENPHDDERDSIQCQSHNIFVVGSMGSFIRFKVSQNEDIINKTPDAS